jgi:hypothetical protein
MKAFVFVYEMQSNYKIINTLTPFKIRLNPFTYPNQTPLGPYH